MAWVEDRATWATRPERRPRDQDRRGRHDAALSFPFGIGTKSGKSILCSPVQLTPYLTTPVSPFHGEPVQYQSANRP